MTLTELQAEVKQWVAANFPKPHYPYRPILGAVEELGELAHAFLKKDQGVRVDENHDAAMTDAVGDIIIYLADFCNQTDRDLDDIVDQVWDKVSQRDWKKNPVSGIVRADYENIRALKVERDK